MIALLLLALSGVAVGVLDKARLEQAFSRESAARRAEASQRERAEGLVQKQEALLEEQESLLYSNRLLLAGQAWLRANMARTEQLLDECPAALRGWEWRYLRRQCHLELLTLGKHNGFVCTVAVAPKGDVIASGGFDNTALLWDATTGKRLHRLEHPKKMVGGTAFSPDGRWLATACGDYEEKGVVYVWDRATMKRVGEFESPPGMPRGLAFNSDSTLLAVSTSFSSKAEVRVQDWQARREVRA